MSVAGLDMGNCTSCVALARKRGVDVIMNSESKRETPAIVSYGEKMRFVGVEGAARMMMNVKNTVVQVKRLIGRKFQDPAVQADIKNLMYKVTEAADGGCLISVMYLNEPRTLSPEQVVTSLLKDLKSTAETDQGSAITDCVVAVPAYFSESERRAMLTAADVAGLKCLRLMNELTAAALNWGIFKPDLPEDQPLNVAFVDIGHSSMQVCIVAFKKAQMEVKAHAWDKSLGGRDFDAVLVAHFAAEFKSKTGLDIAQNPKAGFRMNVQVEKTRQVLTTGPQAPISVECLMEDTDFRSEVTLQQFEQLAEPVLDRVLKPCEDALKIAGLTAEQISSVEMVGGASRTPAIVRKVADFFKQEPKRTMHSKECVSRGCSLQAAMLSPIFQVRHFDVKDLYPFKVNISWEKDGSPTTSQLFGEIVKDGTAAPQFVPCVKNVAFMKTEPFSIQTTYSDDSDIGGASKEIASFNITEPHKAPEGATSLSCKVSFELDLHGLVRCVHAVHCHKLEVEEPAPADAPAATPPAEPALDPTSTPAADVVDGGTPMETDAPAADAKPTVKKTKKVSKDVGVTQTFHTDLVTETKQRLLEEEGQMGAADSLQRATDEAKNALEEYVYMLRSKVSGECADFVKPDDRDALISELNSMEDWLYEDGEDEKKSVYEAKHTDLKSKGVPILLRYNEASTRDQAMQSLSNACQHGLEWVKTTDAKYAHIEANERETVRSECAAALSWLEGKAAAQAALSKVDQPAVLTHELIQRKQTLDNMVHPIMNKPAPPPPKLEAEGKASEEADKSNGPAPMDEDTPGDASAAPDASKPTDSEAQPMDEA